MNSRPLTPLIFAIAMITALALGKGFPGPEPPPVRPDEFESILDSASSVTTQVYPTNIQRMPIIVEARPGTLGNQSKDFTIVVDPEAHHKRIDSGALIVAGRGQEIIFKCFVRGQKVSTNDAKLFDIKKPLSERGMMFQFTIATNYLHFARFYLFNSNIPPPTYVVHLEEFGLTK